MIEKVLRPNEAKDTGAMIRETLKMSQAYRQSMIKPVDSASMKVDRGDLGDGLLFKKLKFSINSQLA